MRRILVGSGRSQWQRSTIPTFRALAQVDHGDRPAGHVARSEHRVGARHPRAAREAPARPSPRRGGRGRRASIGAEHQPHRVVAVERLGLAPAPQRAQERAPWRAGAGWSGSRHDDRLGPRRPAPTADDASAAEAITGAARQPAASSASRRAGRPAGDPASRIASGAAHAGRPRAPRRPRRRRAAARDQGRAAGARADGTPARRPARARRSPRCAARATPREAAAASLRRASRRPPRGRSAPAARSVRVASGVVALGPGARAPGRRAGEAGEAVGGRDLEQARPVGHRQRDRRRAAVDLAQVGDGRRIVVRGALGTGLHRARIPVVVARAGGRAARPGAPRLPAARPPASLSARRAPASAASPAAPEIPCAGAPA